MNLLKDYLKIKLLLAAIPVKWPIAYKTIFKLNTFCSKVPFYAGFLVMCSACSTGKLLIGNVSPVDEPSTKTHIKSLAEQYPDWKRISSTDDTNESIWQNQKTASVISFTSACRNDSTDSNSTRIDSTLKSLSRQLLEPWRNLDIQSEKKLTLSGFPAYEVTGKGTYLEKRRSFQTVNVKSKSCVYDLIFLTPPQNFEQDTPAFNYFRDTLTLE